MEAGTMMSDVAMKAEAPRGPSDEMIAAEGSSKRVTMTIDQLEQEAAELNTAIEHLELTLANARRLRNSAVARLDVLRSDVAAEDAR